MSKAREVIQIFEEEETETSLVAKVRNLEVNATLLQKVVGDLRDLVQADPKSPLVAGTWSSLVSINKAIGEGLESIKSLSSTIMPTNLGDL